jgi:hypothetical protein
LLAHKTACRFLVRGFPSFLTDVKEFTLLYTHSQCKQIKVISFRRQTRTQEVADMKTETKNNEHFFSVELKSKTSLKNVTITNGSNESVLVEGTIGKLVQATFVENEILEVVGEKGVLRINLEPKELKKQQALEVKK